MGSLGKKIGTRPPFLCLVCGVDSGPVRTFLFLFIGTLVGATVLCLAWAYFTDRLRDKPETASLALDAEAREREVPHE